MSRVAAPPHTEASVPRFIAPQLPSLVTTPPEGDEWIHEIKYDGYRTQITIGPDVVQAFTRNGHDWTDKYPRIIAEAKALSCRTALIEGEAIVQNAAGVSDFRALRTAFKWSPRRIVLFAFDLLHSDGIDLRDRPLCERRSLLRELLRDRMPGDAIHFSEEFNGTGTQLFAAVDELGMEGIVSKKASGRYRSGRSESWLKTKCFGQGIFEVIGLEKTPSGMMSALLSNPGEPRPNYAGRAAVTLGRGERDRFYTRAADLMTERPPSGLKLLAKAQWLAPGLAVRVRFLKGEETLRHASIMGLASPDELLRAEIAGMEPVAPPGSMPSRKCAHERRGIVPAKSQK